MFHCNSDDMSKLLMILNNTPAGCRNFEVKQTFLLDFGQDRETPTSFSHGIASIGFVRGRLKFPTGFGLVLFIVKNGNILTDGTNERRYFQRKYNDLKFFSTKVY